MFRFTSFRNFDWVLFGGLCLVACAGMLSLASTNMQLFWKQSLWYGIALLIILFGAVFDWKWLLSQTWFRWGVYGFSVLLLVASNFQPGTIRGTKSWLTVAGIQFEPVELAKLGLLFLLAGFFSKRHISAWQSKNIFLSLVYAAIPAFFILLHPDLGSAVVIGSVWIGFLLMSGIHKKRFLIGLFVIIILAVLMWSFVLEGYQKDRLTGFIFPERDPFGINYNVIQSKIAIGSSGFFGKGFGQGTQTQLKFLPEAQTDFIFASFVEEWGLVGGIVLMGTFFVILYRMAVIGLRASGNYSKFIILGTALILTVHFLINVGANLGVMPVTGITFPFLSYGGSSVLTVAVLISIIEHIKLESR